MVAKREKSIPRRGTLPKPSAGALKPSHGCHGDRVHPPLPTCLVQPSVAHFPPLALPTPILPPSAPPPLPPATHHQCPSPIPLLRVCHPLPSFLQRSFFLFFFFSPPFFSPLHVLAIQRQRSRLVCRLIVIVLVSLPCCYLLVIDNFIWRCKQWIFFLLLFVVIFGIRILYTQEMKFLSWFLKWNVSFYCFSNSN